MSVQNRLSLTSFEGYPHSQSAYKYCLDIVDGKITACEQIIKACQRQIENLTRDNFEYVFDVLKAEKVCNFIELLPHTKGKWAGKKETIKLQPCQQFLLTTLFGWVDLPHAANDEYPEGYPGGYRRFRKLYFTVARKNGKSIIAAGIGLYMMCETNGDFAPEIYAGATNEKQAMEVFKPARLMCKKTPELVTTYALEINASNIAQPESGGKFEPVIGNPGDGASPSLWIVDEYHEHKTSNQVDTATSGMGSREEPLLAIITTAGTDTSSPCYDEHIEACKMLKGLSDVDEQLFALIYTLDPEDDYKDPSLWIKANPMMGVSVASKYIIAKVASATRNASQENLVLIKNMNKWVNAKEAWLNSNDWLACGDNDLFEGDFTQDECIGAIDLSSRLDLTAFVRLYMRLIEARRHYYVFASHFLPSKTIENDKKENDMYLKWVADGDLLISGENEIDYEHIGEHVEGFLTACNIREVTYDTWKASQLAQSLEKKGALMVEYRQQVKEMTQAMKEMEGAISAGRFHHNNDPVLTWQAGNVVNKIDAKGNYYPCKERNHNKIDGMVATIMAIGRAMYDLETDDSVYDKRGVRQL